MSYAGLLVAEAGALAWQQEMAMEAEDAEVERLQRAYERGLARNAAGGVSYVRVPRAFETTADEIGSLELAIEINDGLWDGYVLAQTPMPPVGDCDYSYPVVVAWNEWKEPSYKCGRCGKVYAAPDMYE